MSYIGNSPTFLLKGSKAVFEYTATAGQTAFTGGDDNSAVLKALDDTIGVYSNGVRLVLTDDYTLNTAGDTVTLTSAAALNDIIVIETFDEIANLGTYTKAEADARYINTSGDITTGTIQVSGSGNNIELGANNKVTFNSALKVFHDGSDGFVTNDTGQLILRVASVESALVAVPNGAVTLYHDNAPKIATTSTGIGVTGNATLTSTDSGSSAAPEFELRRDNTGAAANYIGQIKFTADNDADQNTVFAKITGKILDASDGTEDGIIEFAHKKAGSNVITGRWRSDSLQLLNGTSLTVDGTITGDLTGDTTGTHTGDMDLAAIDTDINNTAVDVFIYDTRKDSDGGAWRKRTQHTSWYNETLNTATRGARKEFPAVAVIVVQSTQIKIFDGDDPDLPMWMVWSGSIGYWSNNTVSISAKNGWLFAGVNAASNNHSIGVISFPNDIKTITDYASGPNFLAEFPVSQRASQNIRHSDAAHPLLQSSPVGSGRNVNDIAMTVLPNATIDTATGLPLPTIAVATSGGTSVIRDDGRSVGVMTSNSYGVAFTKNYELVHTVNDASSTFTNHIREIPSADTTTTATRRYFRAGNNTGSVPSINNTSGETTANILATLPNNTLAVATNGTSKALNILQEVPNAPATGMIAYVASDYNTGWMNGDIKLATLSSTADTSYTYDHSGITFRGSGRIASHTYTTGATSWDVVDDTSNNDEGYFGLTVPTEDGKQYTIYHTRSVLLTQANAQNHIQFVSGPDTTATINWADGSTDLSDSITFTAQGSSIRYVVYSRNNATTTHTINVTLAEQDRSVNKNGLQEYGTVTKSAVATGADLMAYSGLSESNYLKQPYNSDLDFGTGDFSIMCWVKYAHSSGFKNMFLKGAVGHLVVLVKDNNNLFSPYTNNGSGITLTGTNTLPNNVWTHVVYTRSSSGLNQSFINGVLDSSAVLTLVNVNDTSNTGTFIGKDGDLASGDSLALTRVSSTIPSPEQIKKIYNDEKHLFQENAKATLYGTSDAVLALAYDDDTELLHAGTSAGRSVFQGLRRIDNTTDAVGVAISASNGMVAED